MGPACGCADEDLDSAIEVDTGALDGGVHLLEIADVGADAQGGSAGVLDFQVAQIQFGLTARDESDAGALGRESNRKSLADATSRAGNQHGHAVKGGHAFTLVQSSAGVCRTERAERKLRADEEIRPPGPN